MPYHHNVQSTFSEIDKRLIDNLSDLEKLKLEKS